MDTKQQNLCGERIKLARVKNRMTQIDLAAALETDYNIVLDGSRIGKIERGERCLYDYELLAFSEILSVPVNWLLKGEFTPAGYPPES